MKKYLVCALLTLSLTACMGARGEDDDLYLVPVTNNPNIVPNYGMQGIPLPN